MTQGYVGITARSANERFAEHLGEARRGSENTLYRAMRKYGDKIVIEPLVVADEEYCLNLERKLRPVEHIGWNVVAGGGEPPKHTSHTEEAKARISVAVRTRGSTPARVRAAQARRGVPRSDASKAKMRERAQGRLPWEASRADKSLWSRAGEIFQFWQAHNHLGFIAIGKHFGYKKPYAIQAMYRKFKQGWNPLQDPQWLGWIQT